MNKFTNKNNLPYVIVLILIIAFAAYKLLNISITGTALEYDLKDNPDMVKVFTQAKEESRILIFSGNNDGLTYSWVYDQDGISDNKDTDLIINPYNKYEKNVKSTLKAKSVLLFKYSKNIKLNGSPRLTISSKAFNGSCNLFKLANGRIRYIKNAVVNDGSVTFDVDDTNGIFIIAADSNKKILEKIKKSTVVLKSKNYKEKEEIEKATKNNKDKKTVKALKKAKAHAKKHSKINKSKGKAIDVSKQEVDKTVTLSCNLTVECTQVLENMDMLKEGKEKNIPSNGYIYSGNVVFYDGENVYDVLKREMHNRGIAFDAINATKYASAYVKGINNLYEKDCGKTSGWAYYVNGNMPNFGCSRYVLSDKDNVVWRYVVKW